MTTPDTNPDFESVLKILDSARAEMLARPGQNDHKIYSRSLDVEITFGDTPVTFELVDKDLQAVIIPTKDGKRMFTKRVDTNWKNEPKIDYPAISIHERHVFEDWANFQDRVDQLIRTYGSLVVPATLDAIGQATIS